MNPLFVRLLAFPLLFAAAALFPFGPYSPEVIASLELDTITSVAVTGYLDPGTGSLALQLLVAGAIGALAVGRTFFGRIKAAFGKVFGRKNG
jgi:hypothetical protein